MDSQTLLNLLFAVAGSLAGWVLKNVHEAVKDLQTADTALSEKVHSIDVLVAGQYVRRSDLEKLTDALFRKLDIIENKLDSKVDKE